MKTTKRTVSAGLSGLAVLALLLCLLPMSALAATPKSDGTFTFTDSGITTTVTDSDAYKIDGTTLKIKAGGTYTITGACSEGSIQVNKETTGVTLILSDLTLSSSTTAPLASNKSTETTLYILGSVTLTDNEDASTEDTNEDYEGAALKVKANASVTIAGTGTLNLVGNSKNGLKLGDDAALNVADGVTLKITAVNDGINANSDLTLAGGTITVSAGDDGIHSDADLTIDGADVTVVKSYEGLEGANVYLNSGSATITASDDGVNAASDSGSASIVINGGKWYVNAGGDGVNAASDSGSASIVINGGKWYVNAGGDGLDAGGDNNRNNATITVNGGETIVFGAANNGNGALDSESGITYNGGTILAVGMSGMAEYPSGGKVLVFGSAGMMGRQGQMDQSNGSVSISAGSSIVIKDASGNTLYSATGVKSANSVVFASDALTEGETYTLYVNGSTAATATAGTAAQGGQMGGQQRGQMPGQQSGTQAPQFGGNDQNGQLPQFGGNDQNGQAPRFGGNDQNGQAPQFGGNDQNGQTPQFGRNEQFGQQPRMGGQLGGQQNNAPDGLQQAPQLGGMMGGFGGQTNGFGVVR